MTFPQFLWYSHGGATDIFEWNNHIAWKHIFNVFEKSAHQSTEQESYCEYDYNLK